MGGKSAMFAKTLTFSVPLAMDKKQRSAGTSRMRAPCGPEPPQMRRAQLVALAIMMVSVVAGSGLVCTHSSSDSRDAAKQKCPLAFEDNKFCDELASAMDTSCQKYS